MSNDQPSHNVITDFSSLEQPQPTTVPTTVPTAGNTTKDITGNKTSNGADGADGSVDKKNDSDGSVDKKNDTRADPSTHDTTNISKYIYYDFFDIWWLMFFTLLAATIILVINHSL